MFDTKPQRPIGSISVAPIEYVVKTAPTCLYDGNAERWCRPPPFSIGQIPDLDIGGATEKARLGGKLSFARLSHRPMRKCRAGGYLHTAWPGRRSRYLLEKTMSGSTELPITSSAFGRSFRATFALASTGGNGWLSQRSIRRRFNSATVTSTRTVKS